MKKPLLTKATFAAAALRCFERYGPQRTSMADIAEEVGASRQSIYRFFEDRSSLILYILNERITALAVSLEKEFKKYTSLEQALVDGTIISMRVAAGDDMMNSI